MQIISLIAALFPSAITMVPSVADIFYFPRNLNNRPARFVVIRDNVFDANFRLFLDIISDVRQAFIDRSLRLLVQFWTGFDQMGSFSNSIIVADQCDKWSKLCSPVMHGHPLASRGNMVRKVYNVIVTTHFFSLNTRLFSSPIYKTTATNDQSGLVHITKYLFFAFPCHKKRDTGIRK